MIRQAIEAGKTNAEIIAEHNNAPPVARPGPNYVTYTSLGELFGLNVAGSFMKGVREWIAKGDFSQYGLPSPEALQILDGRLAGSPGVDFSSPNAPGLIGLFASGQPAIGLDSILTDEQAATMLALGYDVAKKIGNDDVDLVRREIDAEELIVKSRAWEETQAGKAAIFVTAVEGWKYSGGVKPTFPEGGL